MVQIAATPERTAESTTMRSAALGYVVGAVLSTILVGVGGILAGLGAGPAFGLGAFIGVWGGGGFGFMLGATLVLGRHHD
jgi:hypothetical protein